MISASADLVPHRNHAAMSEHQRHRFRLRQFPGPIVDGLHQRLTFSRHRWQSTWRAYWP